MDNFENINKVWILSNERTGSGYLCELLNCTNCFKQFFFEMYDCKVQNWPRNNGWPSCCKIHWQNMIRFFGDFKNFKNTMGEQTKFIYLKREDLISMAVSRAIARKIKWFRVSSEKELFDWQNEKLEISDFELLSNYNRCKNNQNNWSKTLIDTNTNYYETSYEKITFDHRKEIQNIFEFINLECKLDQDIEICANKKIKKQIHPQTFFFKRRLINLIKAKLI